MRNLMSTFGIILAATAFLFVGANTSYAVDEVDFQEARTSTTSNFTAPGQTGTNQLPSGGALGFLASNNTLSIASSSSDDGDDDDGNEESSGNFYIGGGILDQPEINNPVDGANDDDGEQEHNWNDTDEQPELPWPTLNAEGGDDDDTDPDAAVEGTIGIPWEDRDESIDQGPNEEFSGPDFGDDFTSDEPDNEPIRLENPNHAETDDDELDDDTMRDLQDEWFEAHLDVIRAGGYSSDIDEDDEDLQAARQALEEIEEELEGQGIVIAHEGLTPDPDPLENMDNFLDFMDAEDDPNWEDRDMEGPNNDDPRTLPDHLFQRPEPEDDPEDE